MYIYAYICIYVCLDVACLFYVWLSLLIACLKVVSVALAVEYSTLLYSTLLYYTLLY